ncbi:twin-arginine translocase subunit TatC [Engelhardtia mirabilis]|uniref:Sec-independent protein translocase protein TatC n=1 Tax=Engelhardtia mirabilis TaxID=2528011 RepID=A0A518BNT2_9BACT|nr:Sec-independent protein translocase protein TatCy [Planctomycetes bacterium Pla133]QDV02961.1 Sec-independent protein translocase protein TatCy [Planctomycetes bacterium Pla86]
MASKGTSSEQQPPADGARMSLADHLDELRSRLIKGLVGVVLAFAVGWFFKDQVYDIVSEPYHQAVSWLNADLVQRFETRLAENPKLERTQFFQTADPGDQRLLEPISHRALATGSAEAFMVHLKAVFYLALFVGGPLLIWQMWMFIAAGLYDKERRVVLTYLPASLALFLGGVLFGYFVLVPYAIFYLNSTVSLEDFRFELRIAEYFTFLSSLCLGLGVVFQLPIVMNALARAGMVKTSSMANFRGYFALLSFVVAAVITPPDPFTQLMMAVPMILLYELGLWTSRMGLRKDGALVPAGGTHPGGDS